MKIARSTIKIGLPAPLRLLHLSDTHIAFADERDNERKQQLAKNRFQYFSDAPGNFDRALEHAKNFDLIVHTGDLIDFVSYANLDYVTEKLRDVDYFFATGNHEFSRYVGEAVEDEEYKQKHFKAVQDAFPNSLRFASRIFRGVNFVAVDNGYYLFLDSALDRLREEAAKGFPIVLMMHNPIHTDELYHEMMVNRRNQCAYLVGTPEALLAPYPAERAVQQKPDDPTLRFIEEVKSCPQVKAVLTGHLHFNYETALTPTLTQYIAGGGYLNEAREIEII